MIYGAVIIIIYCNIHIKFGLPNQSLSIIVG